MLSAEGVLSTLLAKGWITNLTAVMEAPLRHLCISEYLNEGQSDDENNHRNEGKTIKTPETIQKYV